MGIKIGCPSLKLTHKVSSKATKRTGRMIPVLTEAWLPRWSKDPDVNHELTKNNEYLTGPKSAFAVAKLIDAEAERYSKEKQAAGGRGLRNTASTGWAIILKPPAEYMNGLEPEQQDKFIHDLYSSFVAASADFMAADAIKGAVYQKDEQGAHLHIAGSSKLPDGTICTDKIICPAFWNALNKTIPKDMRQKGWKDVESCQNYDPKKAAEMSEEEKAEYIAKCKAKRPKKCGRSSEEYKAEKEAEKLRAEVKALKEELAEAKKSAAEQKAAEASQNPVKTEEEPQEAEPKAETQPHTETPTKGREEQFGEDAKARISALLKQSQEKPKKSFGISSLNFSSMAKEAAKQDDIPSRPEQPQKPVEAQERPQRVGTQPEAQKPAEALRTASETPERTPGRIYGTERTGRQLPDREKAGLGASRQSGKQYQ